MPRRFGADGSIQNSGQGSGQSSGQGAGKILIIDDELAIRESLETLLSLEGYDVTVAGTAREGMAQIGERRFDVVLLDLALPDKSGMDLLGEIRL
jgi:DNA-binding response OmpR family regulator